MNDLTRRAREALVDVTPGPWRIHNCDAIGDRCTHYFQEIWNDETDILVTTEVTRAHNDGGAANMRFIRAARDLVPALADRLEAQEALLREAMEALAERDGGTHDDDCKVFRPFINLCNCGHEQARATLAKLREHLEDKA